jgi:hypothetical protein
MKRSRYSNRDYSRERSDVAEVASLSRTYFRTMIIAVILTFMLGVMLSDYFPNMVGKAKPGAESIPTSTPERIMLKTGPL